MSEKLSSFHAPLAAAVPVAAAVPADVATPVAAATRAENERRIVEMERKRLRMEEAEKEGR